MTEAELMARAIALSAEHSLLETGESWGGPFGAVVAREGRIVAEGWNQVPSSRDPTAHAEVVAIRRACTALGRFDLGGCTIYTSCEPCPMCLGAIYWARLDRIVFANDRTDAAAIGFDDEHLYRELALPLDRRAIPVQRLQAAEARAVFDAWAARPARTRY